MSLGNAYDNQMPSKLFGYFATGKPVLHLAVSESDPTLPYLARYPLALVLHAGEGVTSGVVAKLDKWLHDVKGKHLPVRRGGEALPRVYAGEGGGGSFCGECDSNALVQP